MAAVFITTLAFSFGVCFSFIAASFVEIQMVLYSQNFPDTNVTKSFSKSSHKAILERYRTYVGACTIEYFMLMSRSI